MRDLSQTAMAAPIAEMKRRQLELRNAAVRAFTILTDHESRIPHTPKLAMPRNRVFNTLLKPHSNGKS